MEDDKKKYEDALERCKKEFNFSNLAYSHEEIKERLEHVFPELKESEDERMIKSFKRLINAFHSVNFPTPEGFEREDMNAWLEKQGEQKQNVTDIISDLENYFATTTKEQQEKDWEEIEKWEEKHFNHNKHIEQKPNFCHHEIDLSNCSEEYRKAYYDGWNNCNQQHAQLEAEQKPADKVEPKFHEGEWITIKE